MACTLRRLPQFERQLKEILKKYPKSTLDIEKEIDDLPGHPEAGDAYPGFNPIKIRKIRLSLAAYDIGKSKGLRLITLYAPEKNIIVPLVIYKKGKPASEHDITRLVKDALRKTLAGLPEQPNR